MRKLQGESPLQRGCRRVRGGAGGGGAAAALSRNLFENTHDVYACRDL